MSHQPAQAGACLVYQELLPDYSGLLDSGSLSDVSVIVTEEQPQTKDAEDGQTSKRPRREVPQIIIPAHKVVLWGMSKFFQAKVCKMATIC